MRYHHKNKFRVIKASGRPETFSRRKLYQSLKRSGLPRRDCRHISEKVAHELGEGTNTGEIFKKTLDLVKKTSPLASVNYSLKKALFDMGPEGHYFELFVARYFEEIGYETETCRVFQGKYVKHEVDVVGRLNGGRFFSECKFHNRAGIKNDIKIALYVKARWDDLKDGPEGHNLKRFIVVSNTAFSVDAMTYAKGTGLELLGVNSPQKESFLETIKKMRLFPVTSLRSLQRPLKRQLLDRGIVLAKDIIYHKALLTRLGLGQNEIEKIMRELEVLEG
ncbi:MAG: restriction endonuclease [Bacteriovoracia bacterium]